MSPAGRLTDPLHEELPPTSRRSLVTATMQSEATLARFRDLRTRPTFWVLLVVCVGLFLWWRHGAADGVLALVVYVVIGTIVALLVAFWITARSVKRVWPRDVEATVDIAPTGLTLTVPAGSWRAEWGEFSAADVVADHLILRMRRAAAAITVPPALYGEDALEVVRDGIRSSRTA